jgi:cysteinyl-tRNA synthetase
MSAKYLGLDFDIHGGGADLQFPHHENEIAQSKCAYKGSSHAKYWIHNGFLTVNGEKMSKSLKNFILVHDLLEDGVSGIVIRYLLLSSHYRKPLDFNDKGLADAKKAIDKFYSVLGQHKNSVDDKVENKFLDDVTTALSDDLNTPKAFAILHELVKLIKHEDGAKKDALISNLNQCLEFFGLYDDEYLQSMQSSNSSESSVDEAYILEQIILRKKAKSDKNWQLADEIRNNLSQKGITLEDVSGGETTWKKS